jgi:hypothetical protein
MAYTKTVWADRSVERPLTFTQTTNADGSITLAPSEGTIITTGTPLTADKFNNMESGIAANDSAIAALQSTDSGYGTRLNTLESDITRRYVDTDGNLVMQRASNHFYLNPTTNSSYLVSIIDTGHSMKYIIGVVKFQNNSINEVTTIVAKTLTFVTNTLGTITVSGLSGTPRFTIVQLSY